MDHLGRDSRHLRKQGQRLDIAHRLQHRHALGDVLGVIADALDHARDLERGDDIPKVRRHRRTKRDQLHRAALGLHLERVELLVVANDLLGTADIALDQAAHRFADRIFGEPAHLADERAQSVEVLVECLERMFAYLLHVRSVQP